jgi:TRAP-type C4-dicarboxylate transport system permease small subunit
MKVFLHNLIKVDELLAKGEGIVLIGFVSVMTGVVFLQVLYRYILTQPLHWSEELARYLFVWLSILGATLGVQKRGHFGLEIFFRMLPQKMRRSVGFLILLLVGALVVVILVSGVELVEKTASQESPAMGIPMSWAYACLPVAAALMTFHLLVIFFKDTAKP